MTNKQVAIIQKDITDDVNNSLGRLQDDGLVLPTNYNASNALKSAFFRLQETKDRTGKPALEVCSRESVANALLDMVTQGLSPAKTQCYFIVYGTQLQMNRSYFGTQAVLKRLSNVKDIWANVVFDGDDLEYEIEGGLHKLISHKTSFLNRDNQILGAYAIVQKEDGEEIMEPMTRKEIEMAWGQSKTKGAVHNKFPQEMAKRTVINRAAKAFINTSDDSDLLVEAINNSTENEYDNERTDITPEQEARKEIESNANNEVIDIEEEKEPTKSENKHQNFLNKVAEKQEESTSDVDDVIEQMDAKEQKVEQPGLNF